MRLELKEELKVEYQFELLEALLFFLKLSGEREKWEEKKRRKKKADESHSSNPLGASFFLSRYSTAHNFPLSICSPKPTDYL